MSRKKNASGSGENTGKSTSYMLVDSGLLKPYANNPKKHPVWQINQLAESIREFGFISPIVVDTDHNIVAGHGRYAAALKAGLKQVPVIMAHDLSQAQIKAYRLADNQLSMNTGYDQDLLRIELIDLDMMETDFDLEITGFSTGTIDLIIGSDASAEEDEADKVPEEEEDTVTESGDRWIMGEHILLCNTSLETSSYEVLMDGDVADAIFTDPPYNVPISGHVCGKGKIKHDEFATASGEMSDVEFEQFLALIMALLIEFSKNGSLHYLCMDWRGINILLNAAKDHYKELKNICVWNKSNAGMGSFYRSKHELISVFKNGSAPHINNVELGKHGRHRSNVWDYPSVNTFGQTDNLKMHPTVKPVVMVAGAIMDCTRRGGIVLDPFGGSGSTLIAAEMKGRKARLIEIEPKYCDVTIRRWQDFTGLDAIHAVTGKTFNETTKTQGE